MKRKIIHNCSLFLFFLVCPFHIYHSFAEGKSDKEILDQLLTNSRYDKRLLPPVEGKVFEYHLNKFLLCRVISLFHCDVNWCFIVERKSFFCRRRQTCSQSYLFCFHSNLYFSGTLTVNVSVLLLSLASPDESSLVSFSAINFRSKIA